MQLHGHSCHKWDDVTWQHANSIEGALRPHKHKECTVCLSLHSTGTLPSFHSRSQLKDKTKVTSFTAGQQLDVSEMFKEGDFVDVAGTTIGKGFQGEAGAARLRWGPGVGC